MSIATIQTPHIIIPAMNVNVQWFVLCKLLSSHSPTAELLEELEERE
jgi:hypothetical protein